MRDLSLGGMAIETSRIFAPALQVGNQATPYRGNRLHLHWEFPTGASLKALGETVWCLEPSRSNSSLAAGLKFHAISRKDLEAIRDYVRGIERPVMALEKTSSPADVRIWLYGRSEGNPGPAGVGVVLANQRGEILAELSEYLGKVTHVTAEFQALIAALAEAKRLNAKSLILYTDSILVRLATRSGTWRASPKHLEPLIIMGRHLLRSFEKVDLVSVSSDKLGRAWELADRAIARGFPSK
jgi:ribonuclease HI